MNAHLGHWRTLLIVIMLLTGIASVRAVDAAAPTAEPTTLIHAEAVRASADSAVPPAAGWHDVTLMDFWDQRWPTYDGVVWYRLRWHQSTNDAPIGLLVSYACLAQAIYVNGSLVYADGQLTEPLSRSWIRPHFFLVDKPLVHVGENILWIRVSGLAAYQPGLGPVTVGAPAAVRALYDEQHFWRYDMHVFSQAIDIVFCGLFLILWLLRRNDSAYGWYALTSFVSLLYNANFLSESTWPFSTTDGWQAFILATWIASAYTYTVFLLRFSGLRWRRTERTLLALVAIQATWSLLLPHSAGVHRGIGVVLGSALSVSATAWFIGHALRGRRRDHRVLAACLALPCVAGMHDLLAMFGVVRSDNYLLALTSPLSLIGMGFALAFRFAAAMRRVEGFNSELRHEVEIATSQLHNTLTREHQLSLRHLRANERLGLVRDIHDGFGGSLLNTINVLGKGAPSAERDHAIATLKELRDDLRLIIDTSAHEQDTHLGGLMAPLRHRWAGRFEIAGMEDRWWLAGLDDLYPPPAAALDLMRFLQEALTNVIRHSHAGQVAIRLEVHGERLDLTVQDDGCGFDPGAPAERRGVGLASMRSRMTRIGAALVVESAAGQGTAWQAHIPIGEWRAASAATATDAGTPVNS